ncbi:tetratricopeptide repeat protein [Aquirufa sp. Wall-65K1]
MKYLIILFLIFLSSCASQVQYQVGISKFTNQDYLGANQDFSEALAKDKRNDDIYFARAASRSLAGYHSLAIADMNKAISLNDSRPDYYFFRAYFKSQLAYHKSAIKDYSICISKAPYYVEVYRHRALSFIELGDLTEACLDIQEAIAAGDTAAIALQSKYCLKQP